MPSLSLLCSSRSPAGEGARPVPPPPLDGLAVGVVTMPLVVASVFLLAEMNRIRGGGSGGGVGEGDYSSKGVGGQLPSSCDAAGDCGGASAVCADGAELSGYLEVILESSTLCAVWEVSGEGGGAQGRASKAFIDGLAVVVAVKCCQRQVSCMHTYHTSFFARGSL